MSKSDLNTADVARLRDASEWVQRLQEPDADALVDGWLQWCRSDPLNLPAFEQMQRLWNTFPQARQLPLPATQSATPFKHRIKLVALAAGVALLGALAGWLFLRYPDVQVLDTPVGEQRRVILSDGSRLDLAPGSRVSARFMPARRDVQLEHGEAFFEVAHDSARPFVVRVNNLSVTAVGTSFDVRTGPESTVVTVGEGLVNVEPGPGSAGSGNDPGPVSARVGQRLTFSKSARRLTLTALDPTAAGSWRGGTLQFMGEPLDDVVSAINRYRALQIVVAPEMQQKRFTGTVSPTEVRDWLKALETIYAVEVLDRGAQGILIRARTYKVARN
jgi:transmembrane sensor